MLLQSYDSVSFQGGGNSTNNSFSGGGGAGASDIRFNNPLTYSLSSEPENEEDSDNKAGLAWTRAMGASLKAEDDQKIP